MENYVFDGSFEGFLTLIFDFYTRKPKAIKVFPEYMYQATMFDEKYSVISDNEKAKRVNKALKNKLKPANYRAIQAVFLSEELEAFQQLFCYCCFILNSNSDLQNNYGNEHVLYVIQMNRSVNREKHHHEAFIRFEEISKDMFFAKIEPKYNVIPLIISHFKNRYANMNWIIYDLTRKYGIIHDRELKNIQEIKIDFIPKTSNLPTEYTNIDEHLYQELWKSYFKSTNIEARKNTRLHIQLLPKRFWKYLTEK